MMSQRSGEARKIKVSNIHVKSHIGKVEPKESNLSLKNTTLHSNGSNKGFYKKKKDVRFELQESKKAPFIIGMRETYQSDEYNDTHGPN